ncbi:hypothetical protein ACK6D9_14275 [Hoeflea sp. Naph1]|uniref:hypothetical protein n=1 Tax=Hoeflea sp. Naph1 TaxID=3388653 RepID=UPI00398FE37D
MPNVCVIAFANGKIETTEIDEWPNSKFIQRTVGGLFAEVGTSFKMEFDATWGGEAVEQATVVYCNETAMLKGLAINSTSIAAAINRELGERGVS